MKAFTLPTIFTAIDKLTAPVHKMNKTLNKFSQSAMNTARTAGIVGVALIAPLGLAANSAIKFEDKMADVAKTTGMDGKELAGLGEDILKMSTGTRTSIEGLQEIAEIGGQLGIKGRDNILKFTDATNKFSVALGSDFQGGVKEAARAIGGLNVLFKETRGLDIATSVTKTGSAINALSAKGVQVPEVTEFTKRIGALPDAIKPSIQDVTALGAVFNKAGIAAEIASRGLGDVLLTATQNAPAFAKQMNMSTEALRKLINSNPTEFLKQFAGTVKGIKASEFGPLAKSLKLGDVGSIKVLGTLSTSIDKLTEYQKIANAEFEKGTSLAIEYGIKNETMAGKIARAKNNFEALSIMIGTELIPIIGDLLKDIMPIVKSFTDWIRENKELVSWIAKVALGVSAFSFAVSGAAVFIASLIKVYQAWITVQMALNLAMALSPITWVILAIVLFIATIVALIYFVVQIIKHWNEWGAAITLLLGPLGFVINLVVSFVKHWDMITKAFKEGGILAGFKAIGKVILDAILYPLQQVLEIIAKVTGADWANKLVAQMKTFRSELGVGELRGSHSFREDLVTPLTAAEEHNQSMTQAMKGVVDQQQNTTLTIKNETKNKIESNSDNNLIKIKMPSTMKFGY